MHPTALATPETYLGLARAERFDPPPLRGTHTYAQRAQARDEPLRAVGHLGRERRRRDGGADAAIHAAIVGKDAYSS